ncbi:MAG TPA: RluA family pseudouridine synthase [Thermoclostridium caenicola]|uniref:Pseudouridine synthase n=1 Tax=Thermoclostridium caenicola TaxID=659425 RepID=A0A1M6HTH1_9FIRM|nr:RluA family pseudouridine synthase [Thermoclostridium caenicola]SHJ25502.1 ribosomal large subunit pseudouridine synthase D [Thermoclostridium caenicola]HOK42856.1 RluA family pseudouridine synthase [Thermoclostridium caenicola]HOL85344.1 RluA family pseudouridine synthase [Thermoclostridium caenicola]HOP72892.1 RluA family pseudouridine synthase [Thermoclostridium caenicola]HPO75754.1 RluA family pseudouridine synthase [Thermoclostridium caenicola]
MESQELEFHTAEEDAGLRLDVWLTEKLSDVTRSFVQKLIEDKHVLVDGSAVKSGFKLKKGMTVRVRIPEPVSAELKPQDIPLDVVYEDADIIVINKQKDMVVHPAAGNWDGTLVNALLNHCGDSLSDINGVIRPGIVHRIDKDTSGLLVVAKNNAAHLRLSDMLKRHEIVRTYEAIVDGVIREESGRIDAPIGRHPTNRLKMAVTFRNAKEAITHYTVVRRYPSHTWVRLKLETGRTHQIRVHMAYIGHPVTGDPLYGKKCSLMDTGGQVLHARFLEFMHPTTGQFMHFEAPLPDYFTRLVDLLESRSSGG